MRLVNRSSKILRPVFLTISVFLLSGLSAGADPTEGLAGKVIVGYQGWFGCPGDYGGNQSWIHWFNGGPPDAERLRVELLPDTSEYPKDALCPTELRRLDGTPIELFSSTNAKVVDLHFHWMAQYGIDGAAVQRFIGLATRSATRPRWDHQLEIERAAAEHNRRSFFVVYGISGADPRTIIADIERDWRHLVDDLHVTSSPSYLRDHGKPVLELWGFGVADRPGEPSEVRGLIEGLKSGAFGMPPVTLIGGVAPEWRTLDGSGKSDPGWAAVYRDFDVISPWYTGRPNTATTVQTYVRTRVASDLAFTRRLQLGFMPVVFPGFSWSNLMRNDKGRVAPLNQIPRFCGEFFWTQIKDMLGLRVQTLYIAMFDEVDEGTAVMKTVPLVADLPVGTRMLDLDSDGCDLPNDWYLRVAGAAGRYLRSGAPPPSSVKQALLPR